MSGEYRLTVTAQETLVEISQWTYKTFGPRQQELYLNLLLNRFSEIANGHATAQPVSRYTGRRKDNRVLCSMAGEHVVLYIQDSDTTEIVDLFHSRSNLKARISQLLDQKREL